MFESRLWLNLMGQKLTFVCDFKQMNGLSSMKCFRNIYMACLWVATKVEEFNVTISQFVENLKENPKAAMRSEDLILALELPIISALKVKHNIFQIFYK